MNLPTENQVRALQIYGVRPATSEVACRKLLQYIEALPSAYPAERQRRADELREVQRRFLGKRVQFRGLDGFGTVLGVGVSNKKLVGLTLVAEVLWDGWSRTVAVELKKLCL